MFCHPERSRRANNNCCFNYAQKFYEFNLKLNTLLIEFIM